MSKRLPILFVISGRSVSKKLAHPGGSNSSDSYRNADKKQNSSPAQLALLLAGNTWTILFVWRQISTIGRCAWETFRS
jgi:hypothetical protein